jgi:hypothetical protein
LQHLNPCDRAFGEGRPELVLDAVGRCFVHASLRE